MNLRRRLNWLFGWLKTVFKWLKVIYDNKWILTALAGVVASAGIGTYQQMQIANKDEQIANTQKQVAAVATAYKQAYPQLEAMKPISDCSAQIAEHVRRYH